MRRETRGHAFLAELKSRRNTPGNCIRCGRPNPQPAKAGSLHGACPSCREYRRQYNASKRKDKPVPPVQVAIVDPARFAQFEQRVRELELTIGNMKRYARAEYNRGFLRGVYREQKRWSNMPRQWDSWKQPIDIEDKKQHFSKLRTALEA